MVLSHSVLSGTYPDGTCCANLGVLLGWGRALLCKEEWRDGGQRGMFEQGVPKMIDLVKGWVCSVQLILTTLFWIKHFKRGLDQSKWLNLFVTCWQSSLGCNSPDLYPSPPSARDCVKAKPEVQVLLQRFLSPTGSASKSISCFAGLLPQRPQSFLGFFLFVCLVGWIFKVCSTTVLLPLFPLIWREVQVS